MIFFCTSFIQTAPAGSPREGIQWIPSINWKIQRIVGRLVGFFF